MSDATRRGFLTLVGTGAATVASAAVAPQALGKHDAERTSAPKSTLHEPLVAHVRDARRGEIALMVGESEIVVRDPDLVARLLRAAGR